MLTSDFDYRLPSELIAQHPLPRGESRMMVLAGDEPARHSAFVELPDWLAAGDLLVVNDTRVIPARLFGRRPGDGGANASEPGGGGRLELLLVEKLDETTWVCLAKPGRRARPGDRIELAPGLSATVVGTSEDGRRTLRFSAPVEPRLDALGSVPLPPYIKREAESADAVDYQTIFARQPGAIAAPTAGLHFTEAIRARLAERDVAIRPLTLHVGIGTFKPVTAELVHEHRMEAERYAIPAATADAIEATRRRGGRVVAVGTTVVRALEAAAAAGTGAGRAGRTDLFIRPGFEFRVIDGLLTNFHLPRSTLLMLVSAFAGRERILAAYREAVERRYRFFSYGDCMLLLPWAGDLHALTAGTRSP